MLEGYKSDNVNFGQMLSLDDEHLFSTLSRILGGQMFEDGTDPMGFKIGMVFRTWSLLHGPFKKAFEVKEWNLIEE